MITKESMQHDPANVTETIKDWVSRCVGTTCTADRFACLLSEYLVSSVHIHVPITAARLQVVAE